MSNLIGRLYYLFWHDICQRTEPFTRQISRIAQAHPVLYWSGLGWVIGFAITTLGVMVWLILHIKSYIKTHLENKPL